MRATFFSMLMLFGCPLLMLFAPPSTAPLMLRHTQTPTSVSNPEMEISPSDPEIEISAVTQPLHVGDTFAIIGTVSGVGLPVYTLTFSSGAAATVSYDNQASGLPARDAQFEIVSAEGRMNSMSFTVRALTAGTASATIHVSGEVQAQAPTPAYVWGGVSSPALTLTISP